MLKDIVPRIAVLLAILTLFVVPTVAAQGQAQNVEIQAGAPVYRTDGTQVFDQNGQPVRVPVTFQTTAVDLQNGFWSYQEADGDVWWIPAAAVRVVQQAATPVAQPTATANALPRGDQPSAGFTAAVPAGPVPAGYFIGATALIGLISIGEAFAEGRIGVLWLAIGGPIVITGASAIANSISDGQTGLCIAGVCYPPGGVGMIVSVLFGLGGSVVVPLVVWRENQTQMDRPQQIGTTPEGNLVFSKPKPMRKRDMSLTVLTLILMWLLAKFSHFFMGGQLVNPSGFGQAGVEDILLIATLGIAAFEVWGERRLGAPVAIGAYVLCSFLVATVVQPAVALVIPLVIVAGLKREMLKEGVGDVASLIIVAGMIGLQNGVEWLTAPNLLPYVQSVIAWLQGAPISIR